MIDNRNMETRKVRADQLRGPVDEGEVTRKGTRILMEGRPCRVVSMRVDKRTGFVHMAYVWITNGNDLASGGGHGEYGGGHLFDEIVKD